MATSIKRKPVPRGESLGQHNVEMETEELRYANEVETQRDQDEDGLEKSNILEDPPAADLPAREGKIRSDMDEQLDNLKMETDHYDLPPTLTDVGITEEPIPINDDQADATQKSSRFKTAFEEVKHFTGGLISHPYEGTKHYSILRHSNGLVFYQGPTTSVAITIFSDQQLPPDRTLWLQKKGFSGKTGLKVGAAMGSRNAWNDVTPSIESTGELLPKADERAWQRDISKFLKKAKDGKHIGKHRPLETDVVRIPHAAEDGYFRVILCAGKKVLCPSPIFRYASSSLDPSILRGASLRTLPIELGVRIGSRVANSTANAAAAGALQPAISTAQTVTQPYQTNGLAQWAASAAYYASGTADKVDGTVDAVNQTYDEKRELGYEFVGGEATAAARIVGSEEGPEQPYPIRFSGKVAQGSGGGHYLFGVPTAKIINVPEEMLLRLLGIYMSWVSISKPRNYKSSMMPEQAYEVWYQAVIMVERQREKQVEVVEQRNVSVYILQDFGDVTLFDLKLNIMLMAFVHVFNGSAADPETDIKQIQDQMLNDIATTQLSPSRPAWGPEAVFDRIKSASSSRSFTERIADIKLDKSKSIGYQFTSWVSEQKAWA